MTNPIDAYLTTKIADPQDRTAQDHALVSQWQQAHQNPGEFNHELTNQAFERFKPTVQTALNRFKGPFTGKGLSVHADNLLIDALKTFNPNEGAAFNTHLTNRLKRLHRLNAQAQGIYTPEGKAQYIGPAQQVHDEFVDEFGRPPTIEEHEQRLNESLPANRRLPAGGLAPILALQKRKSVLSSNLTDPSANQQAQSLEAQNIGLLRQDLTERDRPVYDAIYKDNVSSTGDIAKRLGMSGPAVSRAKNRIEQAARTTPSAQRK
jgi:DNA-directed RNA polymerase specialized sigma subunit